MMNNQQVVEVVLELYHQISRLESLKPSKDVNMLFTKLVTTCLADHHIDVSKLCSDIQEMRSHLIKLCGEAETLLETHYSAHLTCLENPLQNLHLFPYFENYIKLSHLEFTLLSQHLTNKSPTRLAFVGSGPMPLTSIILAMDHFTHAHFHNYDIDPIANALASRLVGSHPGLSPRMFFHTSDIMHVTSALNDYEVVFLAALVGMDDKEEKGCIIRHLSTYMAPGALLVIRSAHGARAFLYPVVDHSHLRGFQILTVHHPVDEVVNSVILARNKIK